MSMITFSSKVPDYTKNRDVRIAFQALQVIHDVDTNHGMHPSTCVELLMRAFAEVTRVTDVITTWSQRLGKGEIETPWKYFAAIEREKLIIETEETIDNIERIRKAAGPQARDRSILGSPVARKLFPDDNFDTESTVQKRLEMRLFLTEIKARPFIFSGEEQKYAERLAEQQGVGGASVSWGTVLQKIVEAAINKALQQDLEAAIESICSSN